ncbi:VF530 family protein [Acinetobacter sp. UBA801]|uniref:VF530 family protein n=2 Tax=unclassified Acinetobacter TaxID=196816 RepID=UPI0025BEADC7|nr:VF530 family protein [Acinetobacter sp. UBA801]
MNTSNDPLHGKKLADILDELLDYYGGFEGLSRKIEIRCFCIDPSVKSSLRFLRTTPWAREKVESLYLYVLRQKAKQKRSPRQHPSHYKIIPVSKTPLD